MGPSSDDRHQIRAFISLLLAFIRRDTGKPWPREDFDPWSELTKERDGYEADAEADRHRL